MTEEKPRDDMTAAREKFTSGPMVVAEVHAAISFGGVRVRPMIDESGKGKGAAPVVKAVKAVIPRAVAESYPPSQVRILKEPVPKDAKPGEIIKE